MDVVPSTKDMHGKTGRVDVAIVGGGPAGTAAALALLRFTRHKVVMVEGTCYDQPRIGETVSSAALPLLEYLGSLSSITENHRLDFSLQRSCLGQPRNRGA